MNNNDIKQQYSTIEVSYNENKGGLCMFSDKMLSIQILESFNFEGTKKNVGNYFMNLERLEWEWAKLNAQKGLTANYDFTVEYKTQPYSPIKKDVFSLSAKENKEEQIKKYISGYYWAKSILSSAEQLYIEECFINNKQECELIDMLGFNSIDCKGFKNLKKSAIYKFADFLDLIIEKDRGFVKCK